MREVVTNNRKIIKPSPPKSGRGRSQKVSFTTGSNCKASELGKFWCFFIVGRLWKMVAYET